MFESTTTGFFPPSSRTTGVRCFAAAAITMRPTFPFPAQFKAPPSIMTQNIKQSYVNIIYIFLTGNHVNLIRNRKRTLPYIWKTNGAMKTKCMMWDLSSYRFHKG